MLNNGKLEQKLFEQGGGGGGEEPNISSLRTGIGRIHANMLPGGGQIILSGLWEGGGHDPSPWIFFVFVFWE